jgi:hypothetical protein
MMAIQLCVGSQAQLAQPVERALLGTQRKAGFGVASMLVDATDPCSEAFPAAVRLLLPASTVQVLNFAHDSEDTTSPLAIDALLHQLVAKASNSPPVLVLLGVDRAIPSAQAHVARVLSTGEVLVPSLAREPSSGAARLSTAAQSTTSGLLVLASRLHPGIAAHRMRLEAAASMTTSTATAARELADRRESFLRKVSGRDSVGHDTAHGLFTSVVSAPPALFEDLPVDPFEPGASPPRASAPSTPSLSRRSRRANTQSSSSPAPSESLSPLRVALPALPHVPRGAALVGVSSDLLDTIHCAVSVRMKRDAPSQSSLPWEFSECPVAIASSSISEVMDALEARGAAADTGILALNTDALLELHPRVVEVEVSTPVARHVRDLATACREHPLLGGGCSIRAQRELLLASKVQALLDGREFVIPEDCEGACIFVLSHRLTLRSREHLRLMGADESILNDEWLTGVPCDGLPEGGGVQCPKDVLHKLLLPSLRQPSSVPLATP